MRVAVVTIGEPLPILIGAADRPLRTGYLSQRLAARGHEVTWWTSKFDHARKQKIATESDIIRVSKGFTLRLLDGGGYKRNVSISRIRDQRRLARKFAVDVRREPAPDIILSSLPPVELSLAAVEFGIERSVPVVLDMRDMWPDIFVDVFPYGTQRAAKILMQPLFRQAQRAISGATAITGITPAFVEWGLKRGNRARSPNDQAFAMGYEGSKIAPAKLAEAEGYWNTQGVSAQSREPIICFFGNMGRMFDLEPVIRGAAILSGLGRSTKFVLCGTGERLAGYRALAAGLENVILPGWVDEAKIQVLLRWAYAGIDPLPERYDYLATINNKAIEYLSAGVPVISSPARGLLAETLISEKCGASCKAGDPQAFADLVELACTDRDDWATRAANARAYFNRELKADVVYARFSELLESISEQRLGIQ